MPRVMMIGGHRDVATMNPFNKPQTVAMPIPVTIVRPTPYFSSIIFAMTTHERLMIDPMEKSSPPEIMRRTMHMVAIPVTELCCRTMLRFAMERKTGLTAEMTTARTTITMRMMKGWLRKSRESRKSADITEGLL